MADIVRDKKRLFIIGASHFGREMESWLDFIPENKRDWELVGFLHSFKGKSPIEGYPTDLKIIGDWETYDYCESDYCVLAISDCDWKEKIYYKLRQKVTFFTYIAPTAIIGKFNDIGEGTIICPGCNINTNVKIGKCVTMNINSGIGHDGIIGDFSSIMGRVGITGKCAIGKKVFIGANAVIIPKIKIGDKSMVGAGSVVIKNVKSGITVFGNPAEKI